MTTTTPKQYRSLAIKLRRVINSKQYKYWQRHEEETSHGWGLKRQYPYRKAAERMNDRANQLEDELHELLYNVAPADRKEIENIDSELGLHFLDGFEWNDSEADENVDELSMSEYLNEQAAKVKTFRYELSDGSVVEFTGTYEQRLEFTEQYNNMTLYIVDSMRVDCTPRTIALWTSNVGTWNEPTTASDSVNVNDSTHRLYDPYNDYRDGVITLQNATSVNGQIVTVADGRQFNVHPIQNRLDGPAIAYGIRFQIQTDPSKPIAYKRFND